MLLLCIETSRSFSGVPNEMRYNGRLRSYQTLVDGKINFNFKIYDQAESGTAIWESGNKYLQVSNGIFSFDINPDKTKVDWRKENLWLQLVVEGKELEPREKLMAYPYSFHSRTSEGLSVNTNDDIEIEVGSEKVYISVKNNKICYKSSKTAEVEYLGVPPGTVIAFAGHNPPIGYLSCDGRELNSSEYPDLFKVIGTTYGGNGSRFRLPDFRGMFLRGIGEKANDLGKKQEDTVRNHRHFLFSSYRIAPTFEKPIVDKKNRSVSFSMEGKRDGNNVDMDEKYTMSFVDDDYDAECGRSSLPIDNKGEENRPVNYSVNYCIKY
jgi:microcystin-dependent protein